MPIIIKFSLPRKNINAAMAYTAQPMHEVMPKEIKAERFAGILAKPICIARIIRHDAAAGAKQILIIFMQKPKFFLKTAEINIKSTRLLMQTERPAPIMFKAGIRIKTAVENIFTSSEIPIAANGSIILPER